MIDLHIHSTYSDGTLTPAELVREAARLELTAIALTDHDCTDGVPELMRAQEEEGKGAVTCLSGVEISAEVPHGTMHMLGYMVDPGNATLADALVKIRGGREERNHRILEKLNAMGLALTWDEVSGFASVDVVGRPHFARAMASRGYVSSTGAAFDRYLGKGKCAYVDRFRLSPEDSIGVIKAAGGVAVLAHPSTLDLGGAALRRRVEHLSDAGLGGIEVYYAEYSDRQSRSYRALARDCGLIATGGSDFHGATNPAVTMGYGFGKLHVPDEAARQLLSAAGVGV